MGALIAGGGSGAVASSAHAGCERFRRTDPLLTDLNRRALARHLGHRDTTGTIPEARWVRAMAFERLVNAEAFVSELLTRAVGLLHLDRPTAVRVRSGADSVDNTATELARAHLKATFAGEATMLTGLRMPFWRLEHRPATDIRPDFAIVAPRRDTDRVAGSWLIMGDAKDYERVRSRIADGRMLKGFLQVALGAESAEVWSKLPVGMQVHRYGALAVPRNVYLRPEAVVEDLFDHRAEVRGRAQERLDALEELDDVVATDRLTEYVSHIEATFDPATCPTCSLFSFCRGELRQSADPGALLVELGIDPAARASVRGLVDGTGELGRAPVTLVAQVVATLDGKPAWTGRRRVDATGLPGSILVALVKSDSAALGVHGLAVQRLDGTGTEPWIRRTYERTNATETRHSVMSAVGRAVRDVLDVGDGPVHLVVPDAPTADLLVSMADSLAGVELSRLRWERDLAMGRPPLTFDGEPATVPDPLSPEARVAVSLLLEEDRARAFGLRQPVIDLRRVLATHVVAGGPSVDTGRLDYLVAWARATEPLDHRVVSDDIAGELHTPGARLSNRASDEMHRAGRPGVGDSALYADLVDAALDYRIDVMTRAVTVLETLEHSRLRPVHRALESDAQTVWGRRLAIEASDLVRFSRTYRPWRNAQVSMLDTDRTCQDQLTTLADTMVARDRAADAGVRHLASARVVSTDPIRLDVRSRRFVDGTEAVLLHHGDEAVVESPTTTLKVQGGSFKLGQMSIGRLTAEADGHILCWQPAVAPGVKPGDELVLGDLEWFGGGFRSGHELAVKRPSLDSMAAPKESCTPSTYAQDPETHYWCCRPHEAAEAEWSDTLAERRARGELNPEVWPPIVDEDRFDIAVTREETATVTSTVAEGATVPEGLTLDDVD